MNRRNKKGHVFSLDVVIAVFILIIGISIVFYSFPLKNKTYYMTDKLSEDITTALAEIKTTDLCINPGQSSGCSCPNYIELQNLVCKDDVIINKDATMLSLFTEVIERASADGETIQKIIKEIFVDSKVIDTKRFGFAILYTSPNNIAPIELYNTEAEN